MRKKGKRKIVFFFLSFSLSLFYTPVQTVQTGAGWHFNVQDRWEFGGKSYTPSSLAVPGSTLLFSFVPSIAADLKEIQKRGYIIVAVKDNLRPLGFRDLNGNLQGLEVDLAQRLAKDLLSKSDAVRLQPVANRDRLSVVLDGKADLTIASVTATESRARLVSFSIPYYLNGTALVTKDASVQKLGDVARGKIAVLKGSSTIAQVRYLLPTAELIGVDSYQEARSLLDSEAADAFAADASVLTGWIQEYPQYRLLPTLLGAEALCVVMPKGVQYEQLRRQVNAAITRYSAEGWLQQRVKYWGLP